MEGDLEKVLSEPEDDIFGMFDEGETDSHLPASIVEIQRKASAASWVRQGGDVSGKRLVSQKEKKHETQVICPLDLQ
jgi:hypothetical protein